MYIQYGKNKHKIYIKYTSKAYIKAMIPDQQDKLRTCERIKHS